MYLHANAKLGLAGRLALVRAIEGGLVAEGGRGRLQRLAGDGASLVASLAGRRARRRGDAVVSARSLEPAAALAAAACRRAAGADLRLPPPDRLGSAAGRRRDRLRALDRLEGAAAGTASRGRRGRRGSRPTATSGPAPAICCTWTSASYARFQRPGHRVTGDRSQRTRARMQPRRGSATTTRTRSSTTTPGSPTSSSTTTSTRRPSPRFLERALAFFADHGIVAKRLMTDNALAYVQEPLAARAARRATRSATCTTEPYRPRTNGKVERFHQTMAREWAYGLAYRSHRRPRRRPATLARTTTTGETTQLTRRPTTDQPRSQRLWAGQLATGGWSQALTPRRVRGSRAGHSAAVYRL